MTCIWLCWRTGEGYCVRFWLHRLNSHLELNHCSFESFSGNIKIRFAFSITYWLWEGTDRCGLNFHLQYWGPTVPSRINLNTWTGQPIHTWWASTPPNVAYFTKEINPNLAKPPLKFNVGLGKRRSTSFVKQTTIYMAAFTKEVNPRLLRPNTHWKPMGVFS